MALSGRFALPAAALTVATGDAATRENEHGSNSRTPARPCRQLSGQMGSSAQRRG